MTGNTKIPSHGWLDELQQSAFEGANTVIDDYKRRPSTLGEVKSLITNFIKFNSLDENIDLSVRFGERVMKTKAKTTNLRLIITESLSVISRVVEDLPDNPIIDMNTHGTHAIDDTIEKELFAFRQGSRVYWDVKEGRVFYDFQAGKLSIVTGDGV